ncbi:MAG: hypothetical protein HYR85_14925 [Planctomycetes bacterium]|nr:hypothetical protein [Planctomycetota bacterium]MBI3846041.1 hypothetical protein [Planctomycetota bacterium]
MMLKCSILAASIAMVVLGGCASSPPPPTDVLGAYLQEVGDSGITPAPTREIRLMECVLWRNASREKPVTIRLKKQCKSETG